MTFVRDEIRRTTTGYDATGNLTQRTSPNVLQMTPRFSWQKFRLSCMSAAAFITCAALSSLIYVPAYRPAANMPAGIYALILSFYAAAFGAPPIFLFCMSLMPQIQLTRGLMILSGISGTIFVMTLHFGAISGVQRPGSVVIASTASLAVLGILLFLPARRLARGKSKNFPPD